MLSRDRRPNLFTILARLERTVPMDRIRDSRNRFERISFLFASGKYFENYRDIPVSPTPLNSPLNLRCCLKLERCLRLENRRRRGRKEIEREGTKDLVLDSKSNPDRVAVKRVAGRSISGETRTRGRDGRASILSLFPARRSHVPARWTLCSAVTCSTLVNKIIIVSTR